MFQFSTVSTACEVCGVKGLKGKVATVTGGNSGFGRGTSVTFEKEQFR
jgi:hypothetical protein